MAGYTTFKTCPSCDERFETADFAESDTCGRCRCVKLFKLRAHCVRMEKKNAEITAERDRYREALKGTDEWSAGENYCNVCCSWKYEGHAEYCVWVEAQS